MRYRVKHITRYVYSDVAPICHNEVHLTPRNTSWQTCETYKLLVRPRPFSGSRRVDYFGNSVQCFTLQTGHDKLLVTAKSRVEVRARPPLELVESPPWETVRDALVADRSPVRLDAFQFVFDSPFIQVSAELRDYATPSFSPQRPFLEAVADLTRRIHHDFKYAPLSTTIHTPLLEVMKNRRGVCQDFAHLQIGCLRALGLPARYVSGYLLTQPPQGQPRLIGADASHAWLAVYCPRFEWVDFDPTNNSLPNEEHITLAWGRDFGDVSPIHGVYHGGGSQAVQVSVDVQPLPTASVGSANFLDSEAESNGDADPPAIS